jgi:hypothetical protein
VQRPGFAGKVHLIAALIGIGWFDPACRNTELVLAKSRLQQFADGYTPADLVRLVREHCQQ